MISGLAYKHKQEYPPLLSQGFHTLSVEELRSLCVTAFPESVVRADIMAGFEIVYERAIQLGFEGEFWINGSFTTRKHDPDDIDFILVTDPQFADQGSAEQRAFIEWLIGNERDPAKTFNCDTDVVYRFPKESPWYEHFTGNVLAHWERTRLREKRLVR